MKILTKLAFAALATGALLAPQGAAQASEPLQLTAQQYFTTADADRSGRLDLKEYVDYSTQLRDIQPEQAAQEFSAMDVNKDAQLSLTELEGTQSLRMALY